MNWVERLDSLLMKDAGAGIGVNGVFVNTWEADTSLHGIVPLGVKYPWHQYPGCKSIPPGETLLSVLSHNPSGSLGPKQLSLTFWRIKALSCLLLCSSAGMRWTSPGGLGFLTLCSLCPTPPSFLPLILMLLFFHPVPSLLGLLSLLPCSSVADQLMIGDSDVVFN